MANVIKLTEKQFSQQVVDYARLRGWKVHAERPARTQSGWRTAIQGDPGWPDLVLVRDNRLLFAELKTDERRSKLTDAQEDWIAALQEVATYAEGYNPYVPVQVYVWRPSDWDEVMEVLR